MNTEPQTEKHDFFKSILLTITFLTLTPIALLASVISLIAVYTANPVYTGYDNNLIDAPQAGVQVYASLPSEMPSLGGEVIGSDARPVIIKNYLAENKSPLEPFSDLIVYTADKYGLDYRLTTAIAQKESGLCRVIPERSHNCWGWGIHSAGTLGFDTFQEGIEVVSKGLKDYYIDLGYVTVEDIMKKYAHPSSTTWAEGVLNYMSQME